MDTLGFKPNAFRMRSGCDTTTPCAQLSRFGLVDTQHKLLGWPDGDIFELRQATSAFSAIIFT